MEERYRGVESDKHSKKPERQTGLDWTLNREKEKILKKEIRMQDKSSINGSLRKKKSTRPFNPGRENC